MYDINVFYYVREMEIRVTYTVGEGATMKKEAKCVVNKSVYFVYKQTLTIVFRLRSIPLSVRRACISTLFGFLLISGVLPIVHALYNNDTIISVAKSPPANSLLHSLVFEMMTREPFLAD